MIYKWKQPSNTGECNLLDKIYYANIRLTWSTGVCLRLTFFAIDFQSFESNTLAAIPYV